MPLSADIAIDYTNKRISKTGTMGSQFYTAQALYSYLMGEFAATGQLDDAVGMSAQTPFDFTMINGWYMQQSLSQNLKGGSIKTSGYNAAIQVITMVSGGYTNFNDTALGSAVSDDGTPIGALLDYDNTLRKIWVRAAGTVATSSAITVAAGTGAGTSTGSSATGEELFSNVYSLGAVNGGNMFILQGTSVLTSWWGVGNSDGAGGSSGNHIDVLVKVMEAGVEISSGDIRVFCRNYGDTYDHSELVDLSSGGRNAVALATAADINNTTAEATIDDYVDSTGMGGVGNLAQIRVDFSAYTFDVDDDGTDENYSVRVDCDGERLSRVYEALKWLCDKDRSTGTTLNALQGRIYITANGAYAPVKANPFGTFAGGKFFGARGVYLINLHADDASNYQTIDNAGTGKTPPTTVSVKVTGVLAGDKVFIAKTSSGTTVDKAQFTSGAGNTSGNNTFVQSEAIPNDTPAAGVLRVVQGTTEDRYTYTSYNRTTRTYAGISPVLARTYVNGTDKCYVPYIDADAAGTEISKSIKYVSDRTVVVRVRRGTSADKIVPYEVASSIASTGLSVPAVRVADAINTNA